MARKAMRFRRPAIWLLLLLTALAGAGVACGGGGKAQPTAELVLTDVSTSIPSVPTMTRQRTPRPVATFPIITPTLPPTPTPPPGTEGKSWEIATLDIDGGDCNDLAFSPDGVLLAVAGRDEMTRLVDPVTGQVVRTLVGHTSRVNQVDFGPDGTWLITASDDGTLIRWDTATGARVVVLGDSTMGKAAALDISPDGQRIASSGGVGVLNIWDAVSGARLIKLVDHLANITGLSFGPQSDRIASADTRGVIILSPTTGDPGQELARDPAAVRDIVYTRDGRLVTANRTGVWVWNVATGAALVLEPVASVGAVDRVAVSPDGALLAALGHDGTTWVWTLSGYTLRAAIPPGELEPLAIALSPHCQSCPDDAGWILAIGGQDGMVGLWGIAKQDE